MTIISNSVVSQRVIPSFDNDTFAKKGESAPLKSRENSKGVTTPAFDNNSFVEKAGAAPLKSPESSQSAAIPVFVNRAEKDVVSAATLKNTAPDIVPSPVEADPDAFTQQVSQALGSVYNLTPYETSKTMEQMNDSLVVLSNKSGFDISTIANGFSGKTAEILQTILLTAQNNQSIMREQANTNNILARRMAEASSEQIIQAGIENRSMVNKQAGIGLATTVASGGVQTKALNNSNTAIKTHGPKSINLQRESDVLSAKAAPGSRTRLDKLTSQDASDIKLLKQQSNRLKHDSAKESLQQQLRANDASKLQMQGMLLGQGGQAVANLSSSNGYVDKAKAEASAQLLKTSENVATSRKEADERQAQSDALFKDAMMQLGNQMLVNRANAARSMIANLKG